MKTLCRGRMRDKHIGDGPKDVQNENNVGDEEKFVKPSAECLDAEDCGEGLSDCRDETKDFPCLVQHQSGTIV